MAVNYYQTGETPLFFARLTDTADDSLITPDLVASITYTCYKRRRSAQLGFEERVAVEGHENVYVPLTALEYQIVADDERWTTDDIGYNFHHEPDCRTYPLFPSRGNYAVVFTVLPITGNPIPIVYYITAE